MRKPLVLALLFGIALPALAIETPVADPVRFGTRGNEHPEAAASDGNDYLFIWRDGESTYGQHYATRVTRDGVALDSVALPLPRKVEHFVWTGTSYLAVWTEQTVGGQFSIESLWLDRDGNAGPRRTLKTGAFPMACIANGKNVVVAYTDYSYTTSSRRPKALVLTADGDPVADLTLANADWRLTYDIAWNGTHFAAVWVAATDEISENERKYAVHGIRFDTSGILDSAPRVLLNATAQQSQLLKLQLHSDGQNFLLLNPSDGRTLARRVSSDLATVSASHLLPEWFESATHTNTFWTSPNYQLMVQISGANAALRLDRNGSEIGTEVIENVPGSATLATTAVATNGQDIAIAWSGRTPGFGCADVDLFATIASATTFTRRFQVLVSAAPRDQRSPLVAAGGTSVLAAWASGSAVYARRFSPEGVALDANPLLLAECGTLLGLAFNGRDYFGFLGRIGGFEIVRVPGDGALRADTGASVNGVIYAAARNQFGTAILWATSDEYLISYIGANGSLTQTKSLGALSTQPRNLSMAASKDDFLIVWDQQGEQQYCTPPTEGGPYGGGSPGQCYYRRLVRGARISSALVNRDPAGLDIATVSPYEWNPKATWNGSKWLVAWYSSGMRRSIDGPRMPDEIRGRFVSRDGVLDGNPTGRLIASGATSPTIEWDGARYAITWQPYDYASYELPSTTRVGWMSDLGHPLTQVKTLDSSDGRAVVAVTGAGKVVASYSRQDPGILRVFLNTIESSSGTKRRSLR